MTLTNQLRQLVAGHGNNSQLARESGLPQSLVHNFKTNPDRGIMLDSAEKLAKVLGCEIVIAETGEIIYYCPKCDFYPEHVQKELTGMKCVDCNLLLVERLVVGVGK